MDYDSVWAKRQELKKELSALVPFDTAFPISTKLVTMEVSRLEGLLVRATVTVMKDDLDHSEIVVDDVDNGLMVDLVQDAFQLSDEPSVEAFMSNLITELTGIKAFDAVLRLTVPILQKVIDSLARVDTEPPVIIPAASDVPEITSRVEGLEIQEVMVSSDRPPRPLSRFGQEFLENAITEAIKSSVGENTKEVQYDQILDCLRKTPSIRGKLEDGAMRALILQIFNKVIQAMNRKSAQDVTQSQDVSELACTYAALMKPAQVITQSQDVPELACTYAALILHDAGIVITSEKIATLVKAANVSVESYWPRLFAKLAEKMNIKDLIVNVSGFAAPADDTGECSAAEGDHGKDSPAED